jgi:DNA-binding NarL/FixJ family response regulator
MKTKNTIQVILADDHAMKRRGIRRILEKASNLCVIAEASTGAEALRLVQELQPDVLVLDIEMPDMKGISVAHELRMKKVPVCIIVLSACDDDFFIEETLQVGVDGYINKSEPPAKIRDVINQISRKHSVAIASLLIVFLPKIGWAFYQVLSSAGALSSNINFL